MHIFLPSARFSILRKKEYSPVSDGSDHESNDDIPQEQTQLVLKLGRQLRFLLICCVILFVVLLVSITLQFKRAVLPSFLVASNNFPHGLNVENLLLAPEFPLVTKVFEQGKFVTEINDEVERRWEDDMPRGRGFVYVPTGHEDHDDNIYVVSVFHQLHCLYMMQKSFTKAMENPLQVPIGEVYHTYHCAELLRQALKCAADPTLDPTVHIAEAPTGRATSGWNGTHVCRDFDSLFAWTDEHRSNDRIGAGIIAGHHDEHHPESLP